MIKKTNELGLIVKGIRLLCRSELEENNELLPEANDSICWWLADIDPDDDCCIAYAEGNYTEEDMFCSNDEANTYIRAALDIESASKVGLKVGDEFIHCGYVFTALSDTLAISNNFLGCAKYYDEEIEPYMNSDDEITCTIYSILNSLFAESDE